jgi:sugar O-acyltransferase (sialic acid O-acetyltransferase NeuD family)
MVVAGAGGHALEVLDVLIEMGYSAKEIWFFDNVNPTHTQIHQEFTVLKSLEGVKEVLTVDPYFCLGVGGAMARQYLYDRFVELGGVCISLKSNNGFVSPYAINQAGFDLFQHSMVHSKADVGKGTLINAGAAIHHEAQIGNYCDIGPGAILLGKVCVGDFCEIGSGAIILPKVILGNNVIVGAGAVVTRNFGHRSKIKGVPAENCN